MKSKLEATSEKAYNLAVDVEKARGADGNLYDRPLHGQIAMMEIAISAVRDILRGMEMRHNQGEHITTHDIGSQKRLLRMLQSDLRELIRRQEPEYYDDVEVDWEVKQDWRALIRESEKLPPTYPTKVVTRLVEWAKRMELAK